MHINVVAERLIEDYPELAVADAIKQALTLACFAVHDVKTLSEVELDETFHHLMSRYIESISL